MNWIKLVEYKVQLLASAKVVMNVRYAQQVTNREGPVPCTLRLVGYYFWYIGPLAKNVLGFIYDPFNPYTECLHTHTGAKETLAQFATQKFFSPDITPPRLAKPF
jgi:hypothetical protein